MNIKQRKIQIEPKTKLNYNIYYPNTCHFGKHDSKYTFNNFAMF